MTRAAIAVSKTLESVCVYYPQVNTYSQKMTIQRKNTLVWWRKAIQSDKTSR